jgi:hypothetical protein
MQTEKNPFDLDPQSVPLMQFMLHSDSLSSEILTKGSPAYRLVQLNSFKEIRIMPLPTDNDNLRKRFAESGLVLTEYYSDESSVALKVSGGSLYNVVSPFTRRLPANLWKPIISDSKVLLADLFASGVCDYLVVGSTEPSLKRKVEGDIIITAEQALELVRILLTAHGRFYVHAKLPINEGFYYLYRFRRLFKEFQHAWAVAVYAHGEGLPEKIQDHLASLGTRLEFICRAYDKVAFFSLKTANHDDQSNQLYHLAYFVMLITGVFDNLAHIIKEFYHMTIQRRMSINLRIPPDEKPNKFYKSLQSKNPALHEFLTAPDIQRDINAFYPIRDSLQHRELPTGIQYYESSESEKNLFELSSETFEELKKISDSLNFIIDGNHCFLDPLPFIKWAQKVLVGLVNRTLSSIDWNSVCLTLPKDIQDKIRASDERFEKRFAQSLGWPAEPLYF